jgi:hypothetical protein
MVIAILTMPVCFGQSDAVNLADAARASRKDKTSEAAAKKVIDNDSLPKEEHVSVVGPTVSITPALMKSDSAESDTPTGQDASPQDSDKSKLTIEPGQSAGDRELVYGEWRKKVADQKDTIKLLQRELDVMQREYRLRAAAMYADVGNRLRNANEWDKEDREYKDKIAAKQKELDRAKEQLSDMQEQARKAGIPAGVVE